MVAASAALGVACYDANGADVEGSGDIVTETYDFGDFIGVRLSHSFQAEITFAQEFSVSLDVDDNVLEYVDVDIVGDSLRFRLDGVDSTDDVTLDATITMPDLESLDLSGATRVTVSGFENMDDLEAELSGASTLEGVLDVTHLDLRLSGASTASLEGGGIEADLDASGASTLDLEDFPLEIAHVEMSGASTGTVNVRDELGPVILSGASHLTYVGTPTLSGVDTSGASSVEPE